MSGEHLLASDLLTVLENKSSLKKGPHTWLREVRDATGYGHGHPRYADALVVSLWPSRGMWLAGVEVKVDRKDWLRELKDPKKAESIQKYCDYWWIATTADVVKKEELPKNWGHMVVTGQKVTIVKQAPKLKPEALTIGFIASVLRNAGECQASLLSTARFEGGRKERDDHEAEREKFAQFEEQLQKLTREKDELQNKLEHSGRDLEKLRHVVKVFEEHAGIPEGTIVARSYNAERDATYAGANYKLALLLKRIDEQRWAHELKTMLDSIDALKVNEQEATGT